MTTTGKTARAKALAMRAELERLSDGLSAIVAELALPSPEEFEAMRSRKIPWTPEAYYAALLRDADFHVDQARVLINDQSNHTAKSLQALFESNGASSFPLERSLRYLVELRSGTTIPPSEAEILHHDPWGRAKIVLEMLLRSLLKLCARLPERPGEGKPGASQEPAVSADRSNQRQPAPTLQSP